MRTVRCTRPTTFSSVLMTMAAASGVTYYLLLLLRTSPSVSSPSRELMIFNRVPKTGSEMFVRLLLALADRNGFVHRRHGAPQPRKLDIESQVSSWCSLLQRIFKIFLCEVYSVHNFAANENRKRKVFFKKQNSSSTNSS